MFCLLIVVEKMYIGIKAMWVGKSCNARIKTNSVSIKKINK